MVGGNFGVGVRQSAGFYFTAGVAEMAADGVRTGGLTLKTRKAGVRVVVELHGRLVAGGRDLLSTEVKRLLPEHRHIVLDLCELTHMDSMGLGMLARLYVSAKSAGCTLELMNLSQGVSKLLVLTNMMSVFSIVGESGMKL